MGNQADPKTAENVVGEVEAAVLYIVDGETGETKPLQGTNGAVEVTAPNSLAADIEQIGGQAQSAVDVADRIDQIFAALASQGTDELQTRLLAERQNGTVEEVHWDTLVNGTDGGRLSLQTMVSRALESSAASENSPDELRVQPYIDSSTFGLIQPHLENLAGGPSSSGGTFQTLTARALQSASGNTNSPDEIRVTPFYNSGVLGKTEPYVTALGSGTDSGGATFQTLTARALDSAGLDELVTRVTDSSGTQVDPATTDGQPNFFDSNIVSHDLIGTGDYTEPETFVRGTGDIIIKASSTDGATFTVSLEWTDGNGNVLYTQEPPEATDVTDTNLKFNVASDYFRLTITDTSGGAGNTINGTINVH